MKRVIFFLFVFVIIMQASNIKDKEKTVINLDDITIKYILMSIIERDFVKKDIENTMQSMMSMQMVSLISEMYLRCGIICIDNINKHKYCKSTYAYV